MRERDGLAERFFWSQREAVAAEHDRQAGAGGESRISSATGVRRADDSLRGRIGRESERELRLQSIEHGAQRLALGGEVYRLGKIGMRGGELLFGEAEAAARGGHRFGAVGREPLEVVGELLAVAGAKRAAGQPQLFAGGEDADDVKARAGRRCRDFRAAGLSPGSAARIRTFSMPDARPRVAATVGRGNLQSALRGQFEFDRRRGLAAVAAQSERNE